MDWKRSRAVFKLTVYGENPFNSFLDSPWGSVVIPLRDLVEDERRGGLQREKREWHRLAWAGREDGVDRYNHEEDDAALLVRMQLELRESRKDPTEQEIEASRAIQAMLDRNPDKAQSAMSTLWNLRENVAFVQNHMGRMLDTVESFKNVFNWTHPKRTACVFAILLVTWVAFVLVPGRYLILFAGMYEFLRKWIPEPEDQPMSRRLNNLLRSLPNDDHLRGIYQREHEEFMRRKNQREKEKQRAAKLHLVMDCQWEGLVKIKPTSASTPAGSGASQAAAWPSRYLVVQGHRLVWWVKEEHLEESKPPEGQMLLQGHSGTTHASPLDLKLMADLAPQLVAVFGRGVRGEPIKHTFLCNSEEQKDALVGVVAEVVGKKDA